MARSSSNGTKKRPDRLNGIISGSMVVLVLHSPREKCWGRLDEINPAGIFLRGLDLNAYEDWIHAIVRNEIFLGPIDIFYPMWRVERLTKDERTGDIPSLIEQFESRTGQSISNLFD
jgi:hypothetical protein